MPKGTKEAEQVRSCNSTLGPRRRPATAKTSRFCARSAASEWRMLSAGEAQLALAWRLPGCNRLTSRLAGGGSANLGASISGCPAPLMPHISILVLLWCCSCRSWQCWWPWHSGKLVEWQGIAHAVQPTCTCGGLHTVGRELHCRAAGCLRRRCTASQHCFVCNKLRPNAWSGAPDYSAVGVAMKVQWASVPQGCGRLAGWAARERYSVRSGGESVERGRTGSEQLEYSRDGTRRAVG